MKYFICGFTGSGKTTKLKLLKNTAKYKDYIFIDLDDYIYNIFGYSYHSLGELIKDKGLVWFRQAEKELLLKLLEDNQKIWIALGGGTLDKDLADILCQRSDVEGFRIEESFDICWQRIQNDLNRPLVALGESKLKEIYKIRQNICKKFNILDI